MYLTLASLRRAGALAWALVCPLFPLLAAAPPANDTCAGAVVVPSAGPFPYWTSVAEVSGATTSGDPVLPLPCGDTNVTRSVWFRFAPASTALYTLSVGSDTATDFGGPDSTDTMMALYTAPGCAGPFTLVACNDDSGLLQSALTANLTGGTAYYVVIWVGASTSFTNQALQVQLRVSRPVPPASDTCAGAEVIPGSGPFPYLSSIQDTTLATVEDDPVAACASYRSVWFKFTPATAGTYIFSTDTDTATTVFDTAMGLFSNSGGCGGSFTQLDCLDDFGSRYRATITRSLTANVPVYLLVWDFEEFPIPGETSLQLRVGLAGPPTVTTLPASSLTTTGVVLNLSINPNTFATRWFFEWGPTTSYGNMTPSRQILTLLTLTQPRSEPIGGFTPGLTYHYRAVGSNAQGRVYGQDETFLISTNRPLITAQSMPPGGDFLLQFTGAAGQLYVIQGSANLGTWTDLGPAREVGSGAFEFSHAPGALPPYRFYKVRAR